MIDLTVNFIDDEPIIVNFIDDEPLNITLETDGPRGESAYQIAVRKGFMGSEQEYLDSLKSDITISPTAPLVPYLNQLWIQN